MASHIVALLSQVLAARGRLIGSFGYIFCILAPKVVQMAPDNPQDLFGPSFRPEPNLLFLEPTLTLVSHHLGFVWPWINPIAAWNPDPFSVTSTSVLSQQQTSVLSQQWTSVLSQQQTSVLSQQQTSILSQQHTSVLSRQQTSVLSQQQ